VPPLLASTVETPGWYRGLSDAEQQAIADRLWEEGRLKLEPWLGERIEVESVTLHPGRVIVACDEEPDGPMRLRLDDESVLEAEHVILATGYEPDITGLGYLTTGLLREIETVEGSPVLDTSFQTSVPGLYMTSKPAARDFGPFMAFTVAARASAVILGNALAGRSQSRLP
jgi:pyruvate/2-oxoglutarate dehydrogenase complex dihydrolipoamide dehydrogenase (E3) component